MAYDLYNFPYARTYDGDLGYLIQVYNDLLEAYKNANLDYSGIQTELETVKAILEKQVSKEDNDYKELKGKIETIEAYLGTGTGTLQETLTQIQSDITSLKTKYETVYSELLNLETSSTLTKDEFTQRFIANETNIKNLQNDTTNLKTRMSKAESAITKNTSNIKADRARIDNLENTLNIGYLSFTPSLVNMRFSNLNFHLYRIGNTLHFGFSIDTTISESNFVTLDGMKGLNYNYGLKLGDFDSTVFSDTFSNGDFITFGSCTISNYLGAINDSSVTPTFYFSVPMCFINAENITSIYALMPSSSERILTSALSIVCNGSAYMDRNVQ